MRSSILYLLPLLFSVSINAQDEPIFLTNPSFEGVAGEGAIKGQLPKGWTDCGFPGETVPDVHPKGGDGAFQVTQLPTHGNTYIGMVVRENDTWEMVSQRLNSPLEAGNCYTFSISLARSILYVSPSRLDGELKNYTKPIKLRIWGGNGYCAREELLDESPLISGSVWREYNFRFEPKQNYSYIVFEAFYNTPTPFPYNGNILLDNASTINPILCKEAPPVLADNTPTKNEKQPVKSNGGTSTKPPKPAVKKAKILDGLDRSKLKKGQIIRIEQIYFKADSPSIVDSSFDVLEEIHDFLAENEDVVIEIGGHTNGLPDHEYCDRLSAQRAKSVVDYLRTHGIPDQQLTFKGYGKRRPIAPNNTEAGRKQNQRVEIKILSFNS